MKRSFVVLLFAAGAILISRGIVLAHHDDDCEFHCPLEGLVQIFPGRNATKTPDLNGDQIVNLQDVAILAPCFYSFRFDPCCDFNCDDNMDLNDLSLFAQHYLHMGQNLTECTGRDHSTAPSNRVWILERPALE